MELALSAWWDDRRTAQGRVHKLVLCLKQRSRMLEIRVSRMSAVDDQLQEETFRQRDDPGDGLVGEAEHIGVFAQAVASCHAV